METIKVYSPIEDKKIRENLNGSPIWNLAYHEDELSTAKVNHTDIYEYTVKFDGLQPIQLTGIKKLLK